MEVPSDQVSGETGRPEGGEKKAVKWWIWGLVLVLVIVIAGLAVEVYWYSRYKASRLDSGSLTEIESAPSSDGQLVEKREIELTEEEKIKWQEVRECLVGKDTGTDEGVLIEVVFDRVELENKRMFVSCVENKLPEIKLDRVLFFEVSASELSDDYEKKTMEDFFGNEIRKGDKVQVNVRKIDSQYFAYTVVM